MGASYSLQSESNDEVNVKSEPTDCTPSRRLCDKRILALDPRSPTEFFDRTPIIVNRTPDIENNKGSHRVREGLHTGPVIKDPRSPTTEFTRTPINPCNPSPVAPKHSVPVTSTVDHHMPEKDICEPESDFESGSFSTTHSDDTRITGSLRSLESAVCLVKDCHVYLEKDQNTSFQDTEVSPDILETSSLDVDVIGCVDDDDDEYEDMDISSSEVIESKLITKSNVLYYAEESTPKLPVVIQSVSHARIGMKPKLLSLTPGVTRSPLSAVNNSPRVLSQRNILPQRGGKPTQANGVFIDKENIHH